MSRERSITRDAKAGGKNSNREEESDLISIQILSSKSFHAGITRDVTGKDDVA